MLKNLGASVKRRLGLEAPNTSQAQFDAQQRERERLLGIERAKKRESRFLVTEGEGRRRFAKLSFGNEDELEEDTEDRRSLRRSGRFTEDRLVL
ncbi:MAG: hypothetical protein GY799_26710 [Desulfobulbaceae bacterium]|nr:hypothetical protein [Desulfobulbaceae bacterium]